MDFRLFDHVLLCEEPGALSWREELLAVLMSDSIDDGTSAQFSDESVVERPSKQTKTQQHRFRMEWKQKALAIKHFEAQVPKMKFRELAEWCKTTFKLDQAPAECTVSLWFKAETRAELLHKLENECSPHVRNMKALYPVRFQDLEAKLVQWFHDMENRKVILTDNLLREQAVKYAKEMGLDSFAASKGWLQNLKKRAQIKQYAFHGEAGSADSINAAISQSTCSVLFRNDSAEDIYNADETGLFWKSLPSRTLATRMRPGEKLQKDRITLMLCCNAAGTHKLPMLVINKCQRPRSFGKWDPQTESALKGFPIMYRWNKRAWMNGTVFKDWLTSFNVEMRKKFARQHETDKKAWLILDNSSTHVGWDGVTVKTWDAEGLKAKGLELSHTKVVFLQPNTTSKIQPLDAGIIANVKAMFRKQLIEHQLAQLSQGIGVQVDIRMAVMWAAEAWADVTTTTIVNCWRKVGILPGECVLCPASNQAMEELRHLLLDFSSATHESLCDIPDCEQIPGEDIVQESLDDDICAAGGAGTAGEPCQSIDDDPEMVEEAPQILSLRDARVAAQGVLYFLMDNQNQRACNALSEKAREISEHLKRMAISSRHEQRPITDFFR